MNGIRLATARVVLCQDGEPVVVMLLDGSGRRLCPAFALPFLYRPAIGDLLTVLGSSADESGAATWVIGLLLAKGRSLLAFRGDVVLQSGGDLRLWGDGGVRLQAPTISLQADVVTSVADSHVQRARSMATIVAAEVDERAGDCCRTIDGEDLQLAGKHTTIASGVVRRDADLLQLG